jgi:hypothetical protein
MVNDAGTEEVKPSELRVGDVVKHGGNMPWVTVKRIVEAGENQPEWERALGSRGFLCEHIDDDGRRRWLIAWDGHDQYPVIRRKV